MPITTIIGKRTKGMTYVCASCGHVDNPIWHPLYWRQYTSYANFEDFQKDYPELAKQLPRKQMQTEDQYFMYKRVGKTRDIIHRTIKLFAHMQDRSLYEVTPSERKFKSPKQMGSG